MKEIAKNIFIKSQLTKESMINTFRELFDDHKIQLINVSYLLYSQCDGTLYEYDDITYSQLVDIYEYRGGYRRYSQFTFEVGDLTTCDECIENIKYFYEHRLKLIDDINFCFSRLQNHKIKISTSTDASKITFKVISDQMDVEDSELECLLPIAEIYSEIITEYKYKLREEESLKKKNFKQNEKIGYYTSRDIEKINQVNYSQREEDYTL